MRKTEKYGRPKTKLKRFTEWKRQPNTTELNQQTQFTFVQNGLWTSVQFNADNSHTTCRLCRSHRSIRLKSKWTKQQHWLPHYCIVLHSFLLLLLHNHSLDRSFVSFVLFVSFALKCDRWPTDRHTSCIQYCSWISTFWFWLLLLLLFVWTSHILHTDRNSEIVNAIRYISFRIAFLSHCQCHYFQFCDWFENHFNVIRKLLSQFQCKNWFLLNPLTMTMNRILIMNRIYLPHNFLFYQSFRLDCSPFPKQINKQRVQRKQTVRKKQTQTLIQKYSLSSLSSTERMKTRSQSNMTRKLIDYFSMWTQSNRWECIWQKGFSITILLLLLLIPFLCWLIHSYSNISSFHFCFLVFSL